MKFGECPKHEGESMFNCTACNFENAKPIKIIYNQNTMGIEDIKKAMIAYKDFYGGDLIVFDEIEKAQTKEQLGKIIDRHRSRLEDMLSDAHSHLDNFKKRIGLINL